MCTRGLEDGGWRLTRGDEGEPRARMTNATINYEINGWERFRGAGGGEGGRNKRN